MGNKRRLAVARPVVEPTSSRVINRVVNSARRQEIQGLQVLFAGFLDLFCDTHPQLNRKDVRRELSSALVSLGVLPGFLATDGYEPVRIACADLLASLFRRIVEDRGQTGPRNIGRLTLPSLLNRSRYRSEFEEISVLGQGGFGTVFKVRSRIDKHLYAVKKIVVSSVAQDLSQKVLMEVEMLADLHHKNIVRYHAGWLELETVDEMTPSTFIPRRSQVHSSLSPPRIVEVRSSEFLNGDEVSILSLSGGMNGTASRSAEREELRMEGRFWKASGDSSSANSAGSSAAENTSQTSASAFSLNGEDEISGHSTRGESAVCMAVYIQMELCSSTLQHLLASRDRRLLSSLPSLSSPAPAALAVVDGTAAKAVFIQLASALQFIHSKCVIHRDVKPGNIFVKTGEREEVRVLLGDFGLSCMASHESPSSPSSPSSPVIHSVGVGTSAYAAPEQLSSSSYDSSVDIYSLGVVLAELFSVFPTESERADALRKLRQKNELPGGITSNWPSVGDLVLRLCNRNPFERPSAEQILAEINSESSEVRGLREVIENQRREIEMLRLQNERLRSRLAENHS